MSEAPEAEEILSLARSQEREYEWSGAAESYTKALDLVSDRRTLGELHGALGLCFFERALQSDTSDTFSEYVQKAIRAHETASETFASLSSPADKASHLRFKALALYCSQNVPQEPVKVKQGLYAVLELQKNALDLYKGCGDLSGRRMLYSETLRTINDLLEYVETRDKRVELVELGLTYGEEAVRTCLDLKDERALAEVYLETSELCGAGSGVLPDANQRAACEKKQEEHQRTALELAEKTGNKVVRAKAVSDVVFSQAARSAGEAAAACPRDLWEVLEDCRRTKNRHAITGVLNSLLYTLMHHLSSATDRERSQTVFGDIKRLAEESVRINSVNEVVMRTAASLGLTYWCLGISYRYYGLLFEPDTETKTRFLDQGIEIAKKIAANTSPSGRTAFLSTYSFHLKNRASIEQDPSKRKKLLLEALAIADEWVATIENFVPYLYQNIGDHLLVYSAIRSELARLEDDKETKTKMLQEAIEYSKKGTEYFTTAASDSSIRTMLADSSLELARVQSELFQLTRNYDLMREAFSTLEKAGQTYSAEGIPIRAAEAFWRLAKMQDGVGELDGAAESFGKAADRYQLVAEKYPQLTETAKDHVRYLEACREIEAAKNSHQEERFQDASNRYSNASKILSETHTWSFLSKYYEACSRVEEAEAFSIEDQWEKALEIFNKASELFRHELDSQKRPPTDLSTLEAEAFRDWLFSARVKQKLSSARATLEEARISMKSGRNTESARCYGKAASKFEELVSDVAEEQARAEIGTTSLLCRAWQKMREAEIEVSPKRYSEAATLFLEAKDSTKKQKLGLLALGNAALCKALEHSTEFQLKRDDAIYASAKRQLDLAARYYVEAGFRLRSDYVVAYTRLFDALTYASKAEEELDPARRKELYILAEKHLQQAAKLFEEGGFAAKKDEVLRHLERVEQGKQLLLTTSEMLSGAAMISSSADVSAPITARDQPIGQVDSESANVQGRINVQPNTLNVGDSAELSIQLINVGRRPAFLVKTEQIVPEDFEIEEKPEFYRVEDRHLEMKEKRLDPLKTEEIRLVLKAHSKGAFSMKPEILYLDETGKQKSYEPEPITVKVKELGISGWLKGK
jgi:hypothetical protein